MDNCVTVRHVFIMERLALMYINLFYALGLCIVLVQLFTAWEFTFTITGAMSSVCSLCASKVAPLVGENARAIFCSQSVTGHQISGINTVTHIKTHIYCLNPFVANTTY